MALETRGRNGSSVPEAFLVEVPAIGLIMYRATKRQVCISSGGGIGPEEFISIADRWLRQDFVGGLVVIAVALFAFWQAALRMMAYEDAGGSMCEARSAL
jgi:hypothetical protein